MNSSLPKPTDPKQDMPTPAKIGRSVAPTGVPKLEGINPALAPKNTVPPAAPAPVEAANPIPAPNIGLQTAPTAPKLQTPPPPSLGTNPGKPNIPPLPVKQQTTAGGVKPQVVQAKKDPKKLIMIIAAVLIGLGIIGSLWSTFFGGEKTTTAGTTNTTNTTKTPQQPVKQTVLTYWGLWEPSTVLEEVIKDYEDKNPGIKIDYRIQSHKDYRERLQTAIASGNGPDIFRYHSAWVPMLSGDLAVLPASVMSANDFKTTFYPSASQLLQIDGKIVGLPLMYEGLGLYYNEDILQTAGVQAPTTWAELKKLAGELSVPADKNARKNGTITRGGLAIGNATNVDHFSDILALLILQNGGDPAEPAYTEVRDALVFYTNFIAEDGVWISSLPSSTVAFAKGDVAMMFAPTWRAHEVKELNPKLKFGIAPVPQLSDEHIAWANYWAEGVNEKSANKEASWAFLKYMTSAEVMKKLYSAESNVRSFGEPYSRTDIASELAKDPYVAGVLQDAPIATGWHMSSATHDNGLNDQIINYYAAAISSTLNSEDEEDILKALEAGVKQVLRQYSVK